MHLTKSPSLWQVQLVNQRLFVMRRCKCWIRTPNVSKQITCTNNEKLFNKIHLAYGWNSVVSKSKSSNKDISHQDTEGNREMTWCDLSQIRLAVCINSISKTHVQLHNLVFTNVIPKLFYNQFHIFSIWQFAGCMLSIVTNLYIFLC